METKTLCQHCRASNTPGDKFCAVCGKSLESPPEASAVRFCPACGAKNGAAVAFCGQCGASVITQAAPPPIPQQVYQQPPVLQQPVYAPPPVPTAVPPFGAYALWPEKDRKLMMIAAFALAAVTFLGMMAALSVVFEISDKLEQSSSPSGLWLPAVLMIAFIGFQAYTLYKPVSIPNEYRKYIPWASLLPAIVLVFIVINFVKSAISGGYEDFSDYDFELYILRLCAGTVFLFPLCFTAGGLRKYYAGDLKPSGLFVTSAVLSFVLSIFPIILHIVSMLDDEGPAKLMPLILCMLLSGGLNLFLHIYPEKVKERGGNANVTV